MNRKERRFLRKHRNQQNRQGYLIQRGKRLLTVMEEPTEAHVKSLLMDWLVPRRVLADVEDAMALNLTRKMDEVILGVLTDGATKAQRNDRYRNEIIGAVFSPLPLRPQITTA